MNLLLNIVNLTKVYGFKKYALDDVSLKIYEGEIFSLLGVNGAGKTTLSSILATLIPPSSGKVSFQNKSIYDQINFYRKHIGFCPQTSNLNDDITLKENLVFSGMLYGMSKDMAEEKSEKLMFELQIDEYKNNSSRVLSGGYKQRFLIARALMHSPKFLILDEPTVALDPHIRRVIWEKIKELKNIGVTVLLTTHYLDEAEFLSDRVCILDKGKVKLIDTPKNLIAQFKKGDLEEVFLELINEK